MHQMMPSGSLTLSSIAADHYINNTDDKAKNQLEALQIEGCGNLTNVYDGCLVTCRKLNKNPVNFTISPLPNRHLQPIHGGRQPEPAAGTRGVWSQAGCSGMDTCTLPLGTRLKSSTVRGLKQQTGINELSSYSTGKETGLGSSLLQAAEP